jgi:hypothetical protein
MLYVVMFFATRYVLEQGGLRISRLAQKGPGPMFWVILMVCDELVRRPCHHCHHLFCFSQVLHAPGSRDIFNKLKTDRRRSGAQNYTAKLTIHHVDITYDIKFAFLPSAVSLTRWSTYVVSVTFWSYFPPPTTPPSKQRTNERTNE